MSRVPQVFISKAVKAGQPFTVYMLFIMVTANVFYHVEN